MSVVGAAIGIACSAHISNVPSVCGVAKKAATQTMKVLRIMEAAEITYGLANASISDVPTRLDCGAGIEAKASLPFKAAKMCR
jgi:hypothetical protein